MVAGRRTVEENTDIIVDGLTRLLGASGQRSVAGDGAGVPRRTTLAPQTQNSIDTLGTITSIVAAAHKLHDALYYNAPTLRALPQDVADAFGELQSALRII